MSSRHQKTRNRLCHDLKDGLILIRSADEVIRNGDINYSFRQESNFLYLTGITKPGYTLVLDPKKKESHLFIPNISDHHRIWIGPQMNSAQSRKAYRTNHVYPQSDFDKVFKTLQKEYKKIYTTKNSQCAIPKSSSKLKKDFIKLEFILTRYRSVKSREEMYCMIKANQISSKGHMAAMTNAKVGMFEYQLQNILEFEFRKQGAKFNAYPSIVATGHNSAILHYVDNNTRIKASDLILIDAGCEWEGYASDITRTFPASGKFTKRQRTIYNIVLDIQKKCISKIKPGLTIQEIHILSCEELIKALIKIHVIKKGHSVSELLKENIHRVFYPHGIGHLLGLDTHDVGGKRRLKTKNSKADYLRANITLKPNMVFTIEPGIYFMDAFFHSKKKRKELSKYISWHEADKYYAVGGIRIEDNILVTKQGHKNLTSVPKETQAIEKIMASRSKHK